MICPLVVLALSSLLLVKELYTKKAGKSTHRKRKGKLLMSCSVQTVFVVFNMFKVLKYTCCK